MIDHRPIRLGKLPAKHDPRTLKLAAYLPAELPPIPAEHAWSPGVDGWPMFRNDTVGDCTCAGAAHQVRTWTGNEKPPAIALSDADVLAMYSAVTGYDPADPESDQGAYLLDVLKYWRATGCAGHKIGAFAQVPLKQELVKAAIYLFGGVYVGLLLPITAQSQAVWDVETTAGDGQPGSWGGHCVAIVDYDNEGLTCATWGELRRMTWAFFATYCDEAYAIISPDWIQDGQSPSGLNMAALQSDLAQVSGQAPVPAASYRVTTLAVGAKGADTCAVLTDKACADIASRGGEYVVRYLPSLTPAEIARIHSHKLALQCCNYSRGAGWVPSASLGANDGARDVAQAKALGLPQGALIWFDLEGCRGGSSLTKAHLEAWASAITAAGFAAGLYVGYAPGGLDEAALYGLRKITRYWQSCSRVPEPATRGFCQRQCYKGNQNAGSVVVDWGQTHNDFLGAQAPFVVAG